ncbi:unnamed protein product [Rotaria socialis]|uniref:Uncharacterized protein n=1 Tax=Rotaria socialis TaxID=392032 RepID=A0A818Q091_9BILA|nr:unnamed protein product [Rotaria socialis]CAF3404426.1 unnamed protein product [Rotaria socialis]CAF3632006.1 unnamed protein product [Rotaria socialis]CAF3652785.1 unnamed protein product [Rotaria socialis]CAF3775610.1 unnamed protein product [Rotaria socialis]
MNFHIHITFNQQQPIININANPTINTNIPNSIYIPANPMGSNAFQYGVATPPMQQANQPNNYNSYPQQMFMPNNEHMENLRSMFNPFRPATRRPVENKSLWANS